MGKHAEEATEFKPQVRIELDKDQAKAISDLEVGSKVIVHLRGKIVRKTEGTDLYPEGVRAEISVEKPDIKVQEDNQSVWDELNDDG